jgi:hypothetical protein
VILAPGTIKSTGDLLKLVEPFAEEMEMTLDAATKGDMDADYATVQTISAILSNY